MLGTPPVVLSLATLGDGLSLSPQRYIGIRSRLLSLLRQAEAALRFPLRGHQISFGNDYAYRYCCITRLSSHANADIDPQRNRRNIDDTQY